MSTNSVSVRTILIVAAVLIVTTVISVSVSFIPLESKWHVTIAMSIGAFKACLVMLFFMQVIASSRLTWVVIVASLVWLTILFTLTLVDFLSRSLLPYAPGH